MLFQLFFAVQRQLVLHHQAGKRQTGFLAVFLQIGCGFVRIRHVDRRTVRQTEMFFINDETTANGVVSLAVEDLIARQRANTHPVLMQRQVVGMEIHALIDRKLHFMLTIRQQ